PVPSKKSLKFAFHLRPWKLQPLPIGWSAAELAQNPLADGQIGQQRRSNVLVGRVFLSQRQRQLVQIPGLARRAQQRRVLRQYRVADEVEDVVVKLAARRFLVVW